MAESEIPICAGLACLFLDTEGEDLPWGTVSY